ncbi:DUF302 domain-containing protein [Bacillus thermotolerans]|uniref:DUF302 domain-containing protein n=1 Tax=Bacillus thermotolerans TaxID=1221996 RepID=A0A0F5HRY7_BACTR|nr:hypothetical protein QY97_03217 [Bacillus thermotolerans]KKB33717.1 hypothetical protein QY96_00412 [Bacillus thermotolerans]KKB35805.1 hypothetical protein QY95_03295 [Bacillus thermotolerans]
MDFHFTVETNKSLEESIQTLEDSLKKESFGVLWTFDIKEKLEEKGFGLEEPFFVLEVCNPKEAERVIKENKLVGYFLPCKIVVYKDQGITKIGMPKPTSLISMLENNELKAMAEDIEKRLIRCIEMTQ